jgi:hypothetical protein
MRVRVVKREGIVARKIICVMIYARQKIGEFFPTRREDKLLY